ncbi:hypothetical protein L198_07982 [Cryptococcus wingfieldii CBS 7118]|uniref:B30.2/SPRY domain-containing protein n=1 Tax=Cryptococcus wingfieldii CBS 7118 TaxID=1295528 RepID=A0A1E3HPA1_9TREE|nr:hypothetical protein L198_07982 [Cryptococcus wingfieldii CBS 7118]ODN78193.1 hypothetical protein L198_07982 [Cryptococcus wingfieldii CBS 7118]
MPPPNPAPLDPFPPLSRSAPAQPSRASYASILRGTSPAGEDDIDRQDVLDDLNDYHRPPPPPMPPRHSSNPSAGPSILSTPSSGVAQGRSVAQGARNPPHQSLTPTSTSGAVPPTNLSPPTPSPTRAARAARRAAEAGAVGQDGGGESGSSFTLEDMLGNVPPPEVFQVGGRRGGSVGTQRAARTSFPALVNPSGERAGEGLLRLVSDLHNARQRNTTSSDNLPSRRYSARPIIPLNLSDSDESMTEGEDDAPAASAIRTRLARPSGMGGGGRGRNGGGDHDNLEEWLDASIFNESRLLDEMRANPLGRDGRERDAERQGDEGAHLHRGGNNRRREYLEWMDHIGDLRHSLPHPPLPPRAEGLQPTNTDLAAVSQPYLVSLTGTRRERSSSSSTPRKRPRPSSPPPHRASYFSHSTLPSSTPLPSSFVPPLTRSHLTLTTHISPSYGPAPLITFKGHHPTREDADATALLTEQPIPLAAGIHYYEAEVLSQGEEGYMSVGWMVKGRNLRRLVGWTAGTWGWHGDDGMLFRGQGAGEPFSEGWGEGDTVGCGVDYIKKTAFFTKNGRLMGTKQIDLPSELHPAVGLRTVGESIAVNFSGPFKYDIDSRVRDAKEEVIREVEGTEVANVVRVVDQLPRPIASPSKAVQEENMDIDLPPSPSHKGKSKASPTPTPSPLGAPSLTPLDPSEKVSAAFVLDHLLHHGHDRAAAMLRQGMARRKVMPGMRPKEEGFAEKSAKVPSFGSVQEGKPPALSDFPSTLSAAHFVASLIRTPFDHSLFNTFWRDLLDQGPVSDTRYGLEWRGLLWQFLFVTTNGGGVVDEDSAPSTSSFPTINYINSSNTDPDPDSASLSLGLKLSSLIDHHKLPRADVAVVKEAFGALANPGGEGWKSGERWRGWREKFADDYVAWVRQTSNAKAQSHLEAAIGQTQAVLRTLAQNQGKTGAAFVSVADVL